MSHHEANPALATAGRPWEQINATVYQLADNGEGEMVNRFSFNVQGNNRMLKPGEDEEIASRIVKAVNSHDALYAALLRMTNFLESFPPSTDPNVAAEERKYICAGRDALALVEGGQ